MSKITPSSDKQELSVPTGGLPSLAQPVDAVPDYMKDAPTGLEEVGQYVVPPRLKVVQPLSDSELRAQHPAGCVVLTPSLVRVAGMQQDNPNEGEPFLFTPLFFFVEWSTWNPRNVQPMIVDRTFDPKHEIALKAVDSKRRFETLEGQKTPDGKDFVLRHVEALNFIIAIHTPELVGLPCLLSYSRGDHRFGSNFCNLIRMRRNVPIYGGVYEGKVGLRKNNEGEWFGITPSNPPEGVTPLVPEALFDGFKEFHLQMAEAHENRLIRPDYEEDVTEGQVVADADAPTF